MADPLSMFAGSIAVAGLATGVLKSLDDLIGRWDNAEFSLESFRLLVYNFSVALKILSDWMKEEIQNVNALTDLDFVQSLANSCYGCLRVLLELKVELDLIGQTPKNNLPWKKKVILLWNENRIKEFISHLTCQYQGLSLLLAW